MAAIWATVVRGLVACSLRMRRSSFTRSGVPSRVRSAYTIGATQGHVRRAPRTGRRAVAASMRHGGLSSIPPGVVALSTSERTRSGWSSARCWAIMPPIEMPWTCAASTPAASITATTSATMSSIDSSPLTAEDSPVPRLSNSTTSDPSRYGTRRCQSRCVPPSPAMSTIGSPASSPARNQWISTSP